MCSKINSFLKNLIQNWRVFGFCNFILKRIIKLKMLQVASSLTFTTLLSIVPLLTVVLTVLSLPIFSEFSGHFKSLFINALVPEYSAKINTYLNQFIYHVGSLTPFSLVILSITSILLFRTIEEALNDIWQVNKARKIGKQILTYWVALTLVPLLIGVGISLWRLFYTTYGDRSGWPFIANSLEIFNSLGITTFILWLIYYFVPNIKVKTVHALIGALFSAVIIEIGRYFFSYYVNHMASYQVLYGAFAGLPVFLFWIYCLWLSVLSGAVLSASISYWNKKIWLRPDNIRRDFQDSIEILLLLCKSQKIGQALSIEDLHKNINSGFDQLTSQLNILSRADYVQYGADGWILKRNADNIFFNQVLRLYITDCPNEQCNQIEQELNKFITPFFNSLDFSLQSFFEHIETLNK